MDSDHQERRGDREPVTQLVRIDDLREPRRTPEEQSTYEFALSLEVDLDVDGIVAEAQEATGLHQFGDPTLLDRLAAQVAAVEADRGCPGWAGTSSGTGWSGC